MRTHPEKWKLQNANQVHCFQSGFRCRDHSTSSERRQNLQKRHEKLTTSQSSRTEQSPEPLYFEVVLYENCFHVIVMRVVWNQSCFQQGEVGNHLTLGVLIQCTKLFYDAFPAYV